MSVSPPSAAQRVSETYSAFTPSVKSTASSSPALSPASPFPRPSPTTRSSKHVARNENVVRVAAAVAVAAAVVAPAAAAVSEAESADAGSSRSQSATDAEDDAKDTLSSGAATHPRAPAASLTTNGHAAFAPHAASISTRTFF